MKQKKSIYLLIIILVVSRNLPAQSIYFPPNTGAAWETISPESLGWCTDKVDTMFSFLEQKDSKAFIVLKDGKIVIEHYFGSFMQDSLWYWASAGKTLTAFLAGIAQEEGYLSIEDSTSKYLGKGWTSCPPDKEKLITIRSQLTMTTGLNDDVVDPYCTDPSCLAYLADAGTRWAYHNAPYTLLDKVIENSTGQNYNIYFNNKIRSRIGMNGLWLPSGYNNVFFSNARSMARCGILIQNYGIWAADTLLHDTSYFNAMINTSQSLNKSYGYLWWLGGKDSYMIPRLQYVFANTLAPDAPPDMIAALGKNGQILNVVPSLGLVIVRMGDAPDSSLEVSTYFNNEIWQKLNDVICNQTYANDDIISFNEFKLQQNYPNPFNPGTKIKYVLGNMQFVQLKVYDVLGREIAALVNKEQNAGSYEIYFDASSLSNGVYFYKLQTGSFVATKKMILLK